MGSYILKRVLLIAPTLFLILLTNFIVIQVAPGGPVEQKIAQIESMQSGASSQRLNGGNATSSNAAIAGNIIQNNQGSQYLGSQGLSQDMVDVIKEQYGFDKPAHERFLLMLKNYAVLDFGDSFFKGKPVTTLLLEKLPVSLSLGLWSTLLIYLISIPLGIYKAQHHGSSFDTVSTILLAVGHAIPVFVFAVILLVLFAGGSYWQIFPLQGLVSENFEQLSLLAKIKDYFWHLALPLLASTIGGFAGLTYLTKFSFMEEMRKQYVLSAKAKGLSRFRVGYGHVFRNAMLIVIASVPAVIMGVFFAGNFLIEIIFKLDGLGLLGFEAVQQRDYPVIFGSLFIFTTFALIVQLISDISYRLIDPRIDFESR